MSPFLLFSSSDKKWGRSPNFPGAALFQRRSENWAMSPFLLFSSSDKKWGRSPYVPIFAVFIKRQKMGT
jgi:hypothetical protein